MKNDIFSTYLFGAACAVGLGYMLCLIVPPQYVASLFSTVVQAIPVLPALPSF